MTKLSVDSDSRRTALLFSPSLQGHRIIYCRVLAEILTSLGWGVVVVGAVHEPPVSTDPLLSDLGRWSNVEVRDIGYSESAANTLEVLATVIRQSRADVTVFTEADDLIPALALLRHRRAPALPGRVVGIFIRSTNYSFRRQPSALARAKGCLLDLRDGRITEAAFHDKLVPRGTVMDVGLVLDEQYARSHASSHQWMPDIFREFGSAPAEAAAETLHWERRLHAFLTSCSKRPVIVYVGPSVARRGYDTLLRLCLDEDGCFLHCGIRDVQNEASRSELQSLRAALEERGALLETGGLYLHADTAALFLRAARLVVLPYRQFDGSSGAMLQAIAAGRPVLVPDRGLMAWRVRSFGLGAVYQVGDERDLRRRFHELNDIGLESYQAALHDFAEFFSRQQVAAAVTRAVLGYGVGAQLPDQRCMPSRPVASDEAAGI